MSRFQSWIVLIFIINICFIVGTEESSRPGNRAWLDLNYNPYEVPNMDLNFVPEDLSEPPAESIPNYQYFGTGAQIPGGGSSSAQILESGPSRNYDGDKQTRMEQSFKDSVRTWDELRNDPYLTNPKWRKICVEMIQAWKQRKGPLSYMVCYPKSYFPPERINSRRRMWFKELKETIKGERNSEAPELLLCNCPYHQLENKSKFFAVKHYQGNKYFLLTRKKNDTHTTYYVKNILPIVISS